MRRFLFGLLVTGILVSQAEAADTAKPFTKRKVTQEEYARACEANDMKILHIDCDKIAEAAFPVMGMKFAGRKEFARWVRELEVRECPQEKVRLARIFTVPTKRVDTKGWERRLRKGEMCLYEDNRPVISLDCGNFINSPIPIRAVVATPEPVIPQQRVDTVWTPAPPVYVPQVVTERSRCEFLGISCKWIAAAAVAGGTAYALLHRSESRSSSYACSVVNSDCPDAALVTKLSSGVSIPLGSVLRLVQ